MAANFEQFPHGWRGDVKWQICGSTNEFWQYYDNMWARQMFKGKYKLQGNSCLEREM